MEAKELERLTRKLKFASRQVPVHLHSCREENVQATLELVDSPVDGAAGIWLDM